MAGPSATIGLEQPAEDERTMAMLAHLLMAFTGFVGPIIILCVKQNSRFVKFHSLQAILWHVLYMAVVVGGVMIFAVTILFSVLHNPQQVQSNGPPPTFMYFMPLLWLGLFGEWVVNLIFGVMYALKANRGEWATYPVFGKWLLPKRLG